MTYRLTPEVINCKHRSVLVSTQCCYIGSNAVPKKGWEQWAVFLKGASLSYQSVNLVTVLYPWLGWQQRCWPWRVAPSSHPNLLRLMSILACKFSIGQIIPSAEHILGCGLAYKSRGLAKTFIRQTILWDIFSGWVMVDMLHWPLWIIIQQLDLTGISDFILFINLHSLSLYICRIPEQNFNMRYYTYSNGYLHMSLNTTAPTAFLNLWCTLVWIPVFADCFPFWGSNHRFHLIRREGYGSFVYERPMLMGRLNLKLFKFAFSRIFLKMCAFSSNLHKMRTFSSNLHKMQAFSWKCVHFHLICIKCAHFQWKCTKITDFQWEVSFSFKTLMGTVRRLLVGMGK